jgi:hypothetical protein
LRENAGEAEQIQHDTTDDKDRQVGQQKERDTLHDGCTPLSGYCTDMMAAQSLFKTAQ